MLRFRQSLLIHQNFIIYTLLLNITQHYLLADFHFGSESLGVWALSRNKNRHRQKSEEELQAI